MATGLLPEPAVKAHVEFVPELAHVPLHPANADPKEGVAVSVTCDPCSKEPEQPPGFDGLQLI